jgi:hypothetical protein
MQQVSNPMLNTQLQTPMFDTVRIERNGRRLDASLIHGDFRFASGPHQQIFFSNLAGRHVSLANLSMDIPARVIHLTPEIVAAEERRVGYIDYDAFYSNAIRGERYFLSRLDHAFTLTQARAPIVRARQHIIIVQCVRLAKVRMSTPVNFHVATSSLPVSPDIVDCATAMWGDYVHRWTIHHIVCAVQFTEQVEMLRLLSGIKRELGNPRNAMIVLIGGFEDIARVPGSRPWRRMLEAPEWASMILRAIDMVHEIFDCPYVIYGGFDLVVPTCKAGEVMRDTMDFFKYRVDNLAHARSAYVTDLFSRSATFDTDAQRSVDFLEQAPIMLANLIRMIMTSRFWGMPPEL